MTMADTAAVMNNGRIEQMCAPVDIYDLPKTAFVANFLGQANSVTGTVQGRSGDDLIVGAPGGSYNVPAARSTRQEGAILIGVRPEKLSIATGGDTAAVPDRHNRASGKVTDASFTGVSTQYLVMTTWGDEWTVFEQNRSVNLLHPGDEVVIHWAPEHTFGLDVPAGS